MKKISGIKKKWLKKKKIDSYFMTGITELHPYVFDSTTP